MSSSHGAELVAPSLQHRLVTYGARGAEHFDSFSTAFTNWFSGDFAEACDEFLEDSPRLWRARRAREREAHHRYGSACLR
ncbi:hypothetical protein [Streptomyces sp. NPDC059479]|uniref:hypothetical protein n=1 Tax=Streptomyces sp. NPDC059479 TaxID=3346848 RepID=UPI00369B2AAA